MIKQQPILITGCPRSGASMIAHIINMCGAFGGSMSKRGMYCNDNLREQLAIPYFKYLKDDPFGYFPLPDIYNLYIPANWNVNAEQIINEDGYKEGQWMYKDSRSALIWPVWNYAYPNAKWIIVRRRTEDIIESCLNTGYMFTFDGKNNQECVGVDNEHDGWEWMVEQYEKRFVEMISSGLNCKVVWPERMIHKDYEQLYELLEWLGLSWKKTVLDFIDPLLWDQHKKKESE